MFFEKLLAITPNYLERISKPSKRGWVAGSDQREGPETSDSGPSLRSDPATLEVSKCVLGTAHPTKLKTSRGEYSRQFEIVAKNSRFSDPITLTLRKTDSSEGRAPQSHLAAHSPSRRLDWK